MSTYAIHSVLMQSMVDDSTAALPAYDLQGGTTGELSFGEYVKLEIQFDKTSGGNINVSDYFVFNPAFFCDAPHTTPLQLGVGWVIQVLNYTGSGLFDINLRTGNTLSERTQRNVKLSAERVSDTRLKLVFFFYAAQDIFAYISSAPRSNSQTLLSAALGVPDLDNSTDSAYRRAVSYLEFLIYHSDASLQPMGVGDPYVRNPAAPTNKSCAYDIGARFLDNDIGATNAWSGGTLTENALLSFTNDVGAFKFVNFRRKPNPFLSDISDDNFATLSFAGQEAILAKDSRNAINISINRIAPFSVTSAVVRLWRVDALISSQPFFTEYNIRTANLPAADATPYPNTIGTEAVFSTPASFSTAATTISLAFSINGGALVSGAEYRLWVGLYDSAAGKSSSHLSNPMRVATDGRVSVAPLVLEGNIQTFEYDYPNKNNLLLAQYQRFRTIMTAKSATYAGSFIDELQSVTCQYVDAVTSRIIATSQYDFVNDVSITRGINPEGTDPVMRKTVVGTDYEFDTIFRVPFSPSISPSNTEPRWLFIFRTPNANGTTNTVSMTADQTVRRKAVNIAEIIDVSFEDYAEYLLGNHVPVDTFCSDTDKYIVRVEIDANPPNANLTAVAVYGNPDGTEIALEENGFTPTYLPLLQADPISSVPTDFGVAVVAYFVLDISLFPSRSQYIAIWAITQDI